MEDYEYSIWHRFISIHALRGEGDGKDFCLLHRGHGFQSTPSVGRATCAGYQCGCDDPISIHALRGEGDEERAGKLARASIYISIHALRGEGDYNGVDKIVNQFAISIHALRGEGDLSLLINAKSVFHISIHALRGEGDYRI